MKTIRRAESVGLEFPEIISSGFTWYEADSIDGPEVAANLHE